MARAAITAEQIKELKWRGPFTGFAEHVQDLERAGYLEFQFWKDPALGSGRTIYTCPAQAAAQDITSGIALPDFARNIVATVAASTAAHVAAVQVIITGTDYNGNALSETLPVFTDDTPGSVTGSKAFKTVTRIQVPAMDGATAQVTIVCGAKLGLKKPLVANTVILATADGVYETTRPTIAFSATSIDGNMVTFNTALNGARDFVVIWLDMRSSDLT